MKNNTDRYKRLRNRITVLRKHMLPSRFDPLGNYTERILDRARGFRLLAHAEIEAYLEDISKEVVTKWVANWKNSKKESQLIVAFLACYHSGWSEYDIEKQETIINLAKKRSTKDNVNDVIELAMSQFANMLKANHGVREFNLRKLINPTGIDLYELDQTWITSLDEFGKMRGDIAHNSISVSGSINPQDENEKVKFIMKGIKNLDFKLYPLTI